MSALQWVRERRRVASARVHPVQPPVPDPAARPERPVCLPKPAPESADKRREGVSFDEVLKAEVALLRDDGEAEPGLSGYQEAHRANLVGLAFSGGGIRSATFNLGLLQGLADKQLLDRFHYLSTVSGGSYVGAWFAAWRHRESTSGPVDDQPLETVARLLQTEPSPGAWVRREVRTPETPGEAPAHGPAERKRARTGYDGERPEVRFLREYSNYLTPKIGLLGGDTFSMVASYVAGIALNLLVLATFFGAVVLGARAVSQAHGAFSGLPSWATLAMALVCTLVALTVSVLNQVAGPSNKVGPWQTRFRANTVYVGVVFPMVLGAWALSAWTGPLPTLSNWELWLTAVLAYGAASVLILLLARRISSSARYRGMPGAALGTLTSAALGIALLFALGRLAAHAGAQARAIWGVPVLLVTLCGFLWLQTGLGGTSNSTREWTSRLTGILLRLAAAWALLFWIVVEAPVRVAGLGPPGIVIGGWIFFVVAGLISGRIKLPTGAGRRWAWRGFRAVAPPVFILGLLLVLALVLDAVAARLSPLAISMSSGMGDLHAALTNGLAAVALLLVALFLSWRVGVNEGSMHTLYRNRLVRCYLGASGRVTAPCPHENSRVPAPRRPHPFTKFDVDEDRLRVYDLVCRDDWQLPQPLERRRQRAPGDGQVAEFQRLEPGPGLVRPYPIFNTTLNLLAGKRLDWQHRKARSFTITPNHVGFDTGLDIAPLGERENTVLADNAFRPAQEYAGGLTLGTSMALSGAALAPNMGARSSPALTFLMAVFNLRLGMWLPNPRRKDESWTRDAPRLGFLLLLGELLGRSNDASGYVYVSDGGHFENLGLYELVHRRCKFIVVSDATEDPDATSSALAQSIERIRTDFQIDVEIDLSPLEPDRATGYCRRHCVIGRVRYELVDEGAESGTLVYLKATLTGNEPVDVRGYAASHPEFPHQSTADQWFDEDQFESYRALGRHIAREVFDVEPKMRSQRHTENLFVRLRERWQARPKEQNAFFRHTEELNRIHERIRTDPRLRFLDAQICPEWSALAGGNGIRNRSRDCLPEDPEERRAGFYLCGQMIQLMECVYMDLGLDTLCDAPDNRGWMNLFRQWSWASMFRVTWAMTARTYGARFQSFCERRLQMDVGCFQVDRIARPWPEIVDEAARRPEKVALTAREAELLRLFDRCHPSDDRRLVVLRFSVANAATDAGRPFGAQPGRDNIAVSFPFGFSLVSGRHPDPGRIQYFRIQRHLRGMGLARHGIEALMTSGMVIRDEREMVEPLLLPPAHLNGRNSSPTGPDWREVEDRIAGDRVGDKEWAEFRRLFRSVRRSQIQPAAPTGPRGVLKV